MSDQSKNLTVNIYGQDYMLKTTADQKYIDKIAEYVSSKMKEVESTGLDATSQQLRIAVLCAMNIADELFQSLDKNNAIITTIETKGNSFVEYIDDRIKEIESIKKEFINDHGISNISFDDFIELYNGKTIDDILPLSKPITETSQPPITKIEYQLNYENWNSNSDFLIHLELKNKSE